MRRASVFVVIAIVACQSVEKPPTTGTAPDDVVVTTTPATAIAPDTDEPVTARAAPWSLTASDGSGLQLTRVDAKAVLEGPLAFTELHLYFHNSEARTREGTFALTLPPGAAVSRFAMELDGRLQEAEVVEKATARRVYDDFLHRRQDPALLEKAAGNQFTARVFPIPPSSDKHIVVSFSQELTGRGYTLPLRGLPKVERITVHLDALQANGTHLTQDLDERNWHPDRDFVANVQGSATAVVAGTYVTGAVAIAMPALGGADPPKAITLLVDTSASRSLEFDSYVKSIRALVVALRTQYGDPFALQVIAFDQDTQKIFDGAAAAYGTSHDQALLERGAAGASNLAQALASLDKPHGRVVVVTDAVMTAGPPTSELAKAIQGLPIDRVDVVLAGGIRDERLAASIVRAGLPRAGDVFDLERGVKTVVTGLGQQVLTNIAIEVPGATWVYPRTIPAARPGSPLMVFAKMAKPTRAIDVVIGGARRTISLANGTPALVERAVAGAQIEEMENALEAADGDAAKKLRDDIAKHSVRSRVLSSQTSMLVLETEQDYVQYKIDRKSLADILVIGPKGIEQSHRTMLATVEPPMRIEVQSARYDGHVQYAREQTIEAARTAGVLGSIPSTGDISSGFDDTNVYGGVLGNEAGEGEAGFGFGRSGFGPGGGGTGWGSIGSGRMRGHTSSAPHVSATTPIATRQDPLTRRLTPEELIVAETDARDRQMRRTANDDDDEDFKHRKKAPALTGKLGGIMTALGGGRTDDAHTVARKWHAEAPGDVLALIGLGESLEAKKQLDAAARIYGSIIDLYPSRADLRRFAGERLERLGTTARSLAIDTYRRAVEDRPDHATGHRLLAYALLRSGDRAAAFKAILAGLDQAYPGDRFLGADRVMREDAGMIAASLLAHGGNKADVMNALNDRAIALAKRSSTRFILYWETDANDVDFHIQDSRGGHAWYSKMRLRSGGQLYADVTTGYGPECFAIEGKPTAGPYRLTINYFSQGPMGYGMGLLQIQRFDGKDFTFDDRPYVIMVDHAYVDLGTF